MLISGSCEAINVGYLDTDFGISLSIDKIEWRALEEKGSSYFEYNLNGKMIGTEWEGVSLVNIERSHLPSLCLNRLRDEFENGAEKINIFVMKKDLEKPLLRSSASGPTMLMLTNSKFFLEMH